jgi:sec-independent protein translocase protein TatC
MANLPFRNRLEGSEGDLPGMSLLEHLEELRKRIIHCLIYLLVGLVVAYVFRERLYGIVQAPLDQLHIPLNFTHPTDGLMLYFKTALAGGAILASPFILYQVWLFISPGMYAHERRYVWPFMLTTVGLFAAGAWFGYHWVLPGAIKVLVLDFGRKFHPILTIEDYTGFFLALILGLGVAFELPILLFFLSYFGVVSPRFLLKHFKYGVLAIFIIAGIICPIPDPFGMCLFACPLLALYLLGIGAAFLARPHESERHGPTELGLLILAFARLMQQRGLRQSLGYPSYASEARRAW